MATLVTGVTGIMGSAIAPFLGEDSVFLVRGGTTRENLPVDPRRVIDGDITKPLCGISAEHLIWLKNAHITRVLHLAANVSFEVKDVSGDIFRTNLEGTRNVLALARELRVGEFHYCGTCYAESRRNPYEESKYQAEQLVRQSGIPFSIYKPGAMVGDYATGEAAAFNGFIGAFSIFHGIATKIRERRKDGNGDKKVSIPVYVVVSSQSTMNIIPVDWVVDTLLKLFHLKARGETYYLTHDRPPLARWAIERGFEIIEIEGIRYLERPIPWEEKVKLHGKDHFTLSHQKVIDALLDKFIPYCIYEEQFSLDTVRQALGDFVEPPEITFDFLRRLFTFAASKNFGLRLRSPRPKKPEPSLEIATAVV